MCLFWRLLVSVSRRACDAFCTSRSSSEPSTRSAGHVLNWTCANPTPHSTRRQSFLPGTRQPDENVHKEILFFVVNICSTVDTITSYYTSNDNCAKIARRDIRPHKGVIFIRKWHTSIKSVYYINYNKLNATRFTFKKFHFFFFFEEYKYEWHLIITLLEAIDCVLMFVFRSYKYCNIILVFAF